jgi:hypothetical protein
MVAETEIAAHLAAAAITAMVSPERLNQNRTYLVWSSTSAPGAFFLIESMALNAEAFCA